MAHLVGDLVQYFKFDEVNIDNWHFKLYYKGGTILFFVGSLVGVLTQYFGDAINCDFTTINQDVASDYCWYVCDNTIIVMISMALMSMQDTRFELHTGGVPAPHEVHS